MKFLWVLALFLLLALSFTAGRFTARTPSFDPGPAAGGDVLDAAWEDFIRSQQETLALFRASPFFEDDQERAEAYRGVLYALVGSIKSGALQDPDQPRFMAAVDWASKSGLDNPDNVYYTARVSDDAVYRLYGNRGSTADMVFQLVVGEPGVAGAGTSTNISLLNGADMQLQENGDFEILVSREDPGPGVNWLPSGEGAGTLLVRFTHSDWSVERAGGVRIEKVGAAGESSIPLAPARMAAGLRRAAVSLFDRNATWLQYASRAWNLMPPNGVSTARPTEGGLVGQYSAFGTWELDNDQALVLSTVPSAARYQGIQLGNLWFVSLDYETRPSSLTLDQMECSEDGRCYAVISHRDPGIRNWLDTGGHRRGLIMLRWQGLHEALSPQQQPRARLVKFADLQDALPADLERFSEAQRREQIRTRRAAVQSRSRG